MKFAISTKNEVLKFGEVRSSSSLKSLFATQVDTINTTLRKLFPACPTPWDDLQTGINFWKQVVSCVESIAEPLQAEYLLNDVREADEFLRKRMEQIGARHNSRSPQGSAQTGG